jgi:predicted short-subunit dehydrogenase-like oxidoreductase (DUF2520 family)
VIHRLAFVGPGKVGLAIGYALQQSDAVDELAYYGRRPEPPGHPLFVRAAAEYHFGLEPLRAGTEAVLLTVPDDALPEVAHALASQGPAPGGCAALHCSGALSAELLAPLHARGFAVGSLHPLQAIAHPLTGAERLPGSAFAVSGEPEAAAVARRLVAALGGRVLEVAVSRRPAYHAAAVLASNGLAALLAAAGRLLVQSGVAADEALPALLPLVRGSVSNFEEMGIGQGLTGPVSRGDLETVRLHLATLAGRDRLLYRALSRELTELAAERGDPEYPADELRTLLREGP